MNIEELFPKTIEHDGETAHLYAEYYPSHDDLTWHWTVTYVNDHGIVYRDRDTDITALHDKFQTFISNNK